MIGWLTLGFFSPFILWFYIYLHVYTLFVPPPPPTPQTLPLLGKTCSSLFLSDFVENVRDNKKDIA
jgi:hypothetical protein